MDVWSGEFADQGGAAIGGRRGQARLNWLLAAASRLRGTGQANSARWKKEIRALHAECDQLRRRMQRAR